MKFEKKGYEMEITDVAKSKSASQVLECRFHVSGIVSGAVLVSPEKDSRIQTWAVCLRHSDILRILGVSAPELLVQVPEDISSEIQKIYEAEKKHESEEKRKMIDLLLSGALPVREDIIDGYPFTRIDVPFEILHSAVEIILAEYDLAEMAGEVVEKISGREPVADSLPKIVYILCEKLIQEKAAEKEMIAQAIAGKKSVLIAEYTSSCDGTEPECSTDIIRKFAESDGSIRYERIHTY